MKSTPPLTSSLELRQLPIEDLTPAPYNPRRVLRKDGPAYRKLERSIREFGLVEPLVWNERTGHVVGGHARLSILCELGFTQVPVSVVRLSDAREKALNIVLNNQEAQGRYDPGRLASILAELQDLPELELTGFDAAAIATLSLEPLEQSPEPDAESNGNVHVTLEMDEATFARVRPRLDVLISDFDLVSHVQRC